MKNGVYKTRIKAKDGLSRRDRVYDWFMDTLYNGVEYWGEADTEECYSNIGKWALQITNNLSKDSFDVVFKMLDDNVVEFWYIDHIGTIKKVFG